MTKTLLLTFALLATISSQTFAGTEITTEIFVGGSAVGQSFSPSNHVTLWADVHPENGYVVYSWHSGGNRKFGVDDKSSTMYWQDGTNIPNKSLADHMSGNNVWASPWKAL